eukprot:3594740-Pleurochrysis_carterae.AAC.4
MARRMPKMPKMEKMLILMRTSSIETKASSPQWCSKSSSEMAITCAKSANPYQPRAGGAGPNCLQASRWISSRP